MPTVTINGLGDVDFPESMSLDAIRQASRDLYQKYIASVPSHGPGVAATPSNAGTPPATRALMAQAASDPEVLYAPGQKLAPPPEGTIGPDTRGPVSKAVGAVEKFFAPAPEGQMPQTAGQVVTGIPTAIGRGVHAAEKLTGTEGVMNYPLTKSLTSLVRKDAAKLGEADSGLWQSLGAAMNAGANTTDALSTPENLILAAGLNTPPGLIRKMSAVGFGAPMLRHAAVAGQGALASIAEDDVPAAIGQGAEALSSAALGASAMKHGAETAPMETGGVSDLPMGPSRQEGMALKRTATLKEIDRLQQEIGGERQNTRKEIIGKGIPAVTPTELPVEPGQGPKGGVVPLAAGDVEQVGKPVFENTPQPSIRDQRIAQQTAADTARLADQQARIKTRGAAIDALNAGESLHPAVMDKFFGDLPPNAGYVDTGNGKGLTASERTPDGRVIQKLPRADPDTEALMVAAVQDHFGSDDFQKIADGFAQENGVGGKVLVGFKNGLVPETKTVKGGNWRLLLPKDASPEENAAHLTHELYWHVKTKDGHTVLGDMLPHNDSANQMLADKIVQEGVPSYNGIARPASPDENFAPSPPLPTPGGQSVPIMQKMAQMVGMGRGEAVAKAFPGTIKSVAKHAGQEVFGDLRSLVGSQNLVRAMNFYAKREINDLYGDETAYDKFRAAKISDNLKNKAAEYMDYSKQIKGMGDKDILSGKGDAPRLLTLLEQEIQGTRLFPDDTLAATIKTMIDKGKAAEARDMMSDVYDRAAAAVPKRTDPTVFDSEAFMADPLFLKANDIYRKYLGHLSEEARAILGKDDHSTHVGDFGHYPLVALGENGERVHSGPSGGKPGAFVAGRQEFFRSGLHDSYDPSEEALIKASASYYAAAQKKVLLDTLEKTGWQQPITAGNNPVITTPDGRRLIEINGVKHLASQPYEVATRAGGVRQAVTAKFMRDALEPILDPQYRGSSEEAMNKIGKLMTKIQLSGIGDAVTHSVSEAGTLTGNIPYIKGKTTVGSVLGNLPGIKLGNVVRTAAQAMTDKFWDDPQNVKEVTEMGQNGELPSRFLSTQSAHGLLGNFLWGEHGSDIVGRVIMRRSAKEMNPDLASTLDQSKAIMADPTATPEMKDAAKTAAAKANQILYDWTTKMGNYVPEFQGAIGRWASRTGVGPFHVAGTTMNRNAVQAWTSTGKMPFDSQTNAGAMKARAINQLNAGALGATALWTATYVAMTGKPPWQDPDSKLLEIPVPDSWKDTPLGRVLWAATTKRGQKNYINMGYFINPLLGRGARILPIEGTYSTLEHGGTLAQVFQKDLANFVTSRIQPYAGPAIHAATGAFGVEPALADVVDDRGRWRPQLYSTGAKASLNPLKTAANVAGGMAHGLNPSGGSLVDNAFGPKSAGRSDGEKAAAVIAHLFPPTAAIFQSANPEASRGYLKNQANALARNDKPTAEEIQKMANEAK
jgi:hypothetical protein